MSLMRVFTACVCLALSVACSRNAGGAESTDGEKSDSLVSHVSCLPEKDGKGSHVVGSNKLSYEYHFVNDKSLPVVVNTMEYQYYDNRVNLTIGDGKRQDVRLTFTKNTFRDYVPEKFLKKSGLIGFCYNYDKENDRSAVFFIATIGDPDLSTDMSYALEVRVMSDGTYSVSELKDRDTLPVKEGMTVDPNAEHDALAE